MAAIFYLAYGSNLHPLRLQQRVPNARPIGPVALPGFRLVFHKIGMDGSGKCDLLETGYPNDQAWGALYSIDVADKMALDEAEGTGYVSEVFPVAYDGGTVKAVYYRAKSDYLNPGLCPFDWYREMVLVGAHYHFFPAGYINMIERVPTEKDPDAKRDRLNRELIASMLTVFP